MTSTATRRGARPGIGTRAGSETRHVRDRFDDVPESNRVGAHRGPRPRGGGWIVFAWAALATGLLVVVGLYGLSRAIPGFSVLPTAAGTAAPAAGSAKNAAPVTDPKAVDPALKLSITVLNGSPADTADKVGDRLTDEGWPVEGTADASPRNAKTTVVYYSRRDLEGVARGMVEELGTGEVQLSDVYPSPVTIVLGSDYTG